MRVFSLAIVFSLVLSMVVPITESAAEDQDDDTSESEFEQLRERWVNYLVPNDHIDMDNPTIKRNIDDFIAEATEIWETMDTNNPDYLWEDISRPRDSGQITFNYRNLRTLAEAYRMEVSPFYQNEQLLEDIIYGLDWMEANRYSDNGDDHGNWWDFQIGAPQALNDTVVLVHDHLTDEQINRYMNAIKTYVPDPTVYYSTPDQGNWELEAVGANLVDLIKVVVVQGINSEEEARVLQGRDAFPTIEFKTSGTGDGLYFDGSFVDHSNIAYTGTYGTVLLGNMLDMNYLLAESAYSLNQDDFASIYTMIEEAFQPVIYRGLMMDMVNGRAISREATQNIGYGVEAIEHIIQYTDIAPLGFKEKFQRMVKQWLLTGDNLMDRFESIPVISIAKDILDDDTITPRGELVGHYNFANMDRVTHRTSEYAFSLSMYSNRIGAYEGNMNGENLKGHYTGSGMTYLYNNDLEQYADGFWATVDPVRLPGITVDPSKELTIGLGTGKTSPQSWVGGTTMDGLYGINGMYLDQFVFGQSLKGKKSWFMFDDEIVALGADIQSDDGAAIETIVENRKLNDDGNNPLVVDNEQMPTELGWELEKETNWAHLTGNVDNSDIGYYFPDQATIQFDRQARSGAWNDINTGGSEDLITRNYLQMSIDHGIDPTDGSYQYVLLPNKTTNETAAYAESADIEILANNDQVQAVKENKLGIIGANFWENGKTTIDKITSYHKAAVMVKENNDILQISVTDPTHENDVVKVVLDYRLDSRTLDPRVEVVQQTLRDTTLAIDVDGALGDTITAEFTILPKKPAGMLDQLANVLAEYIETGAVTGSLVNKLTNKLEQAIHHENNERPLQAVNALENFAKHLDKNSVDNGVKADLLERSQDIIEVIHYNVSGPGSDDIESPEEDQPDNDDPDDSYRMPVEVTNGSFEASSADGNIPGWNVSLLRGSANYQLSEAQAFDGNTSLRLHDNSTGAAVIINSDPIPVIPGAEYHASFQVYLEEGRTSAEFHMYDESGNKVSNNPIYIDAGHGDWQTVDVLVTAPEEAAYAEFGAVVTYQWMGTAYYDSFTLTTDAYEQAPEIIGVSDRWYTADASPSITVKGKENGTIYVYEDDTELVSVRSTGEEQTIDLPELAEGEHELTIHAIYDDGVKSIDGSIVVVVDTIAPAAPVVLSPEGPLSTYDRTPTIVLEAEPSTTVIVENNGEVVGRGEANEDGEVEVTTSFLEKGNHHMKAKVVDKAGNESEIIDLPKIVINNGKNM